nr:SDR family NAD(P)-dependent oxidoreductase [Streptomyces cinnamoneus]
MTGSSRGLGLLIARELTRRGCRVMLCARDDDELARAERMLREEGADVRSLACDITDEQAPGGSWRRPRPRSAPWTSW